MTLEEFREYAARYNVIPVWKRILADHETPLTVYKKLAGDRSGTFLLESAEHGGVWSRSVSYTHLTLPTNREV